jgi:ferredoxin
MEHKKQGYRFENDWAQEYLENRTFQAIQIALTIPVNVKIKAENYILSFDMVKKILKEARIISISECKCRLRRGNCDSPIETHINLNVAAEHHIKNGTSREIDIDEALEILQKTHEAGLVHMALGQGEFYEPGLINTVCSCCSCCCGLLSGILRFGLAPHMIIPQAVSVTDLSACDDCGICVDRCQFGAREIINGSLSFNPDLCFGCGLCVTICPTKAITLIEKPVSNEQLIKIAGNPRRRITC